MMSFHPRILVVTQVFPNSAFPHRGSFISERVRALTELAEVRVLNPVPYFPPIPGLGRYSRLSRVGLRGEMPDGTPVFHPRYFVLAKTATFLQGWTMARALRRQVAGDRWRPDIIDAHFAFPDGYAAVRLAQAIGCPVLVTSHGSDLAVYPHLPITRGMMQWTMRHATRVIGVAPHLREMAIELGCPPTRANVLPAGVDYDMFFPRNRLQCRTELKLPIDRPVAVCIASMDRNKNQTVLLEALALVHRGDAKLHLVLLGDGPMRRALQQRVASLGLQDDVTFAGSRPYAEIPQWLSAADWLLLASRREGWPTVYFEAMACGRPVLTSNVGAARHAINRQDLGMIVVSNSAQEWARTLEAARARKWDQQVIRQHAMGHGWRQWAHDYLELVREVLGRGQYVGAAA